MIPTLLLCTLIALTSGLHFGLRFAQARRTGQSRLLPVVAHGVIATPLVILTALLDPTGPGLLWIATLAVSLASLGVGALWTGRAATLAPTDAAPVAESAD
ncbi:hypothetical protein [Deinococcus sedimenti]|uniref:Uncharacterized protein n=1 Tax=Deinococcus sedimenti TaxID=1867090 RepID=A0ABQ2S7P4_9DEIO|nr:hypothetical protein [Deinococcus sedimenti]GGS04636.1 hypothetical protein GCM10008960_34090 [Deinococcus sedimenti]